MSKPRRKKKTKEPLPNPGHGIQRTTSELIDWSTRPARGALEAFSSPSSPLPPLPNSTPQFQTPPRLEPLESSFAETARRLARRLSNRITTPFTPGDTSHSLPYLFINIIFIFVRTTPK